MCLADLCVTASSIRFRKEKTRQNTQPAQPTRCHRKYGSHFHLNSPTGKRFHMRLYSQSKVALKVKFMICFAACAFTAYIMCFFPFLFFSPHKLLAVMPSFMLCFPVETQHLHFMSPLTFFCCCCCRCCCAAAWTCHWADLLGQSFPCRLVAEILSLLQ